MRILIVSDYYPPFIGGAHRQTRLLAHELRRRGHDVRVATAWQASTPAIENDQGITVHRLRQLRTLLARRSNSLRQHHPPPFPDPITVWQLRRVLDQFEPDVVHSYGWMSYSCAAALSGRSTPMLLSGRDYGYSCATRTLCHDGRLCSGPALLKCVGCSQKDYGIAKACVAVAAIRLGRVLLRSKMRGFHSVSTFVQEMARRDLLPHVQQRVLQTVIPSFQEDDDGPVTPEIDERLRQLPSEPFILFVGAFRVIKGLAQLLAAYARLRQAPPLVLIGTVERDTPHEFPPGTVILQKMPHRGVMAAWERCLFGVTPSLLPEPLGSVVYEGMSCGKAVIGTTPGGHGDMIIHNETGLLVPAGDVDALAQAMQRLIDDEPLRKRLGEAAIRQTSLFQAGNAVRRFEEFYSQLLEGNREQASQGSHVRVT